MDKLFDIVFLDDTFEFFSNLEKKHYEKIIFNIRKAQTRHDPELFKKLKDEIWEFRTHYQGLHYRLFVSTPLTAYYSNRSLFINCGSSSLS